MTAQNTDKRLISEVRKKVSVKRRKRRLVWTAIILIAAIYLASGDRGTFKLIRFYNHKNEIEKEIEELKKKKAELEKIQTKLQNDPDYIEKIAREKYKMKKKGEKVYQVVEK